MRTASNNISPHCQADNFEHAFEFKEQNFGTSVRRITTASLWRSQGAHCKLQVFGIFDKMLPSIQHLDSSVEASGFGSVKLLLVLFNSQANSPLCYFNFSYF